MNSTSNSMGRYVKIGLGVVVAVFLVKGCSSYNSLVSLDEQVQNSWGQVENQYQRRADLIPNLVATVKGYAQHEEETFTKVTEARAKATSTTIDASKLDEQGLQRFQANQDALSSALSRLMVVSERYPELKASEQFQNLQAQLEGTENRITTARMDFNNTAKQYNTEVRSFPMNMLAGMFGFSPRPYFKAKEGSDSAPQVDFGK
ncbi:MAG: LemA family protein [Porphyromonas sp.]|nr:LemA family protein [Porphyromonas sp.]